MACVIPLDQLGWWRVSCRPLIGILIIVVIVLTHLGYSPDQAYQFLVLLAALAISGVSFS